MSNDQASIRNVFFQECEEQVVVLEKGLSALESGDTSPDVINATFRAIHSIKGGAGAFKLNELVSFAHAFETVLDNIRSRLLPPNAELLKLMLRAVDVLADMVIAACNNDAAPNEAGLAIIEEFNSINGVLQTPDETLSEVDFRPISIEIPTAENGRQSQLQEFEINFRPFRSLYVRAVEPQLLFRELGLLGKTSTTCSIENVPLLQHLDANESYLAWSIGMNTHESLDRIAEAFEFAEGDCELDISSSLKTPEAKLDIQALLARVRGELPASAQVEKISLESANDMAVSSTEPAPKRLVLSVDAVTVPNVATTTIRVETERIDRLVNLVGELLIAQAMLTQLTSSTDQIGTNLVTTSLEHLEQLTRDLQESVLAIRAQPVKSLFQRMTRTVREIAATTSKDVRLKIEGEATEIDQTVIEQLADPLTHMIRNAIDHGLEAPAERQIAGKPKEGVIRLSAAHRSGRVVIEVADDGAGIDRAKVLQVARHKGLVPIDANPSDIEIDNLLFLPGFSTASSVSSISGRGVGMDVVKRAIQALGGRITINSQPKLGSTFSMSLPLTLAVIDGIVVGIDDQIFVIPMTAILETMKPANHNIHPMGEGCFVIKAGSKFVPMIDVGVEIGIRPSSFAPPQGIALLVESQNRERNALMVDSILDQRQVVIKSLETNYGRTNCVSAATILGDGQVAMILDVERLIKDKHKKFERADLILAKAS